MKNRTGAKRVLVDRPEGKRPLGKSKHIWEDTIKIDLQEVGHGGMDWTDLVQDRER
jgi:hypothetical protein